MLRRKKEHEDLAYSVVSESEAKSLPYPYVFVNNDGTARELHPDECSYLETRFYPTDGGRPYVKGTYDQKNGLGELGGFCLRSKIPSDLEIQGAPSENPSKPMAKEELIKLYKEKGYEITRSADDTITILKSKRGK